MMDMDNLQTIDALVAEGRLDEALAAVTALLDSGMRDDGLFFARGKIRWRLGDRSGATSDYAMAVSLNPESPAANALEQARDVADFFNPDLYNP